MDIIKVIMGPYDGEEVNNCHLEAIIHSAKYKVNVEYTHNNHKFQVIFNDLFLIPKELAKTGEKP